MLRLMISVALASVTGLEGSAAAEDSHYTKESTAIFDAKAGKVYGSIPPGTPLEITRRSGGRAKVVIEGWSQEYKELELYSDVKNRIERATLARIDESLRKVVEETTDEWGSKWMKVRFEGWVDKSSLTDDVSKVWKSAIELYESRCFDCHEYRPPELLTPSQWRGTLIIMSHRAALTPEETALLRQYFQTHARTE